MGYDSQMGFGVGFDLGVGYYANHNRFTGGIDPTGYSATISIKAYERAQFFNWGSDITLDFYYGSYGGPEYSGGRIEGIDPDFEYDVSKWSTAWDIVEEKTYYEHDYDWYGEIMYFHEIDQPEAIYNSDLELIKRINNLKCNDYRQTRNPINAFLYSRFAWLFFSGKCLWYEIFN